MKKASTRYTSYDKDLILAAMKAGAQNGIHQEEIAAMIAPLLQRKASAIVSQIYLLRGEWLRQIDNERLLANTKVKAPELTSRDVEREFAATFREEPIVEIDEPEIEIEPEPEPVEDEIIMIKDEPETPTPRTALPARKLEIGDEIEVVVTAIHDYGAFVRATQSDSTGLIHISNVSKEYVYEVSDWLYVGQVINARVVNERIPGKYGFSAKDASNDNIVFLYPQAQNRMEGQA